MYNHIADSSLAYHPTFHDFLPLISQLISDYLTLSHHSLFVTTAFQEIALKSDSQGEEDDADTVATTTSIQDSINEKYNDSLRRDSPFMSIAMKIIHKAKKNNLMTSALKTLMSDNLVDRRPSKFGRSYVYFLLKKGEKINVEKIFPYDIRKTLDLLISESATEYLDIETAKKYFTCGGEEEDAQRRPVGRHRTKVGANISGPLNEKKTNAMWPIDSVVSVMSTGASNRHRTPEIRKGKRRRDSELEEEEVEVEDDQNGDVEENDTLGAKNVLKSTQTPTVSMRVALAPANRAAKAEKIMNSDQPYGGVPLSDIALFFVTGALGCRLVVRALQVQFSLTHSTQLKSTYVLMCMCYIKIEKLLEADQSAADYVPNLSVYTVAVNSNTMG